MKISDCGEDSEANNEDRVIEIWGQEGKKRLV